MPMCQVLAHRFHEIFQNAFQADFWHESESSASDELICGEQIFSKSITSQNELFFQRAIVVCLLDDFPI